MHSSKSRNSGSSFARAAGAVCQLFARRDRRRWVFAIWGLLTALGWLWYLPFVSGRGVGFHGLAWAYSQLLAIALLLLLVGIVAIALGGMTLCVLLLMSLKPNWRRSAHRGVKKLLVLLLVEVLLFVALLPTLFLGYAPKASQVVSLWRTTYRAVYVAFPIDDNHGDIMLLNCHWLGPCHQVYRGSTDIISAGEADLAFNARTNQVGLRVQGQWVYVRSPNREPCTKSLALAANESECRFIPSS
ncbi:hypothetical protein IQ265_22520 [Nodosilinea sp. LEGE 06152]|uniref:hypothetical protein n=1 Tax=Nodosilinea sp. LEGE 06152 TaxID=2777966 RepID=UPI00187EE043|nr:hypothetical protein [Nodosilinea sp. LEGE 06152]MBE9159585.1 hypothetical protein [Nodosilinea sp. LEGE 06152]